MSKQEREKQPFEPTASLRAAEDALRASDAWFRGLWETGIIGVVICDSETGEIFQANDEYLRIIGRTREELEAGAINWKAITPPAELATEVSRVRSLRKKDLVHQFDKNYVRPDGTVVSVLVGGAFLPEEPGKIWLLW